MRNNKIISRLLIVLVIGIWGTVLVRVTNYSDPEGPDATKSQSVATSKEQGDEKGYIYVDDVRDPFYVARPARKDSLLKKAAFAKPAWTPPPFKLTGIMVTEKKKTATVEGSGGSVFFLQKGDTLAGMKIMKIDRDSVTYYYHKKKDKWVLLR